MGISRIESYLDDFGGARLDDHRRASAVRFAKLYGSLAWGEMGK
jgi:hypothetical protein